MCGFIEKTKPINVEIDEHGTKCWYNERGQFHRVDGPAREWANGTKEWYQNGQRHRLDGPAIEFADNTKYWYQNNLLHRTDGPAIEFANDIKEYWVEGKKLRKSDFTNIPQHKVL